MSLWQCGSVKRCQGVCERCQKHCKFKERSTDTKRGVKTTVDDSQSLLILWVRPSERSVKPNQSRLAATRFYGFSHTCRTSDTSYWTRKVNDIWYKDLKRHFVLANTVLTDQAQRLFSMPPHIHSARLIPTDGPSASRNLFPCLTVSRTQ